MISRGSLKGRGLCRPWVDGVQKSVGKTGLSIFLWQRSCNFSKCQIERLHLKGNVCHKHLSEITDVQVYIDRCIYVNIYTCNNQRVQIIDVSQNFQLFWVSSLKRWKTNETPKFEIWWSKGERSLVAPDTILTYRSNLSQLCQCALQLFTSHLKWAPTPVIDRYFLAFHGMISSWSSSLMRLEALTGDVGH